MAGLCGYGMAALLALSQPAHLTRGPVGLDASPDEFIVLLSCSEDHARRKAAEIKTAFSTLPCAAGLPRGVGLSVGCVEASDEAIDPMALVEPPMS